MMKYFEIDTIKDVETLSVSDGNVILITERGVFINDVILLDSGASNSTGFFVNEHLLVYGNNEVLVKFDIKENKKQNLNPQWSYYWETFNGNEVIVSFNRRKIDGKRVVDYFRYDLNRDELANLNLIEVPDFYYHKGLVLMIEKNVLIRAYDFSKSKSLWEIDLNELGSSIFHDQNLEIRQIIGVQEKNLLLSLTNKEVVSLDIETGHLLWHTTNFVQDYLSDWRNQSLFSFSYWHIEGSKIFQLDGNKYISVDLNNREVNVLWEDSSKRDYLTIIHKTYTPEYIYFTASRNHAISPELIGVFNRKSLNIDWVSTIKNLKGSLNRPPHVTKDRIYVIDSERCLHIFEKGLA